MSRKVDPPAKWHGGKTYLADKILALFPPRERYHTYVEPYGGMASVLLAHNPEGKSEVYNDLDGRLYNFWSVLQHQKKFLRFKRLVEATPFSEKHFEVCKNRLGTDVYDDVENAYHFFVVARQSRAANLKQFATTTKTRTRRGMNEQVSAWLTSVDGLPVVHTRLIRVLLRCAKATDLIVEFNNNETVLYLDCPYHPDTRADKDAYGKLDMTVEHHETLCAAIKHHKGFVLLSGYDNPLYQKELSHFRRVDFQSPNHVSGSKTKRIMTESIWLNY